MKGSGVLEAGESALVAFHGGEPARVPEQVLDELLVELADGEVELLAELAVADDSATRRWQINPKRVAC